MKQVGKSQDSESETDDLWLDEEVGGLHKLYQLPIEVPYCADGVNVYIVYGATHWRLGINSIRNPVHYRVPTLCAVVQSGPEEAN